MSTPTNAEIAEVEKEAFGNLLEAQLLLQKALSKVEDAEWLINQLQQDRGGYDTAVDAVKTLQDELNTVTYTTLPTASRSYQ